jgi:hypothetical protein
MKISLPLTIYLPRVTMKDKSWQVNLNVYRNTHHRVLSAVKVAYKEQVMGALYDVSMNPARFELEAPYRLIYTLYPKTKIRLDVSNVLSIVQKFTDDALVDLGYMEDDSYHFIRETIYRFGMIDPDNPRAELEIEEYRDGFKSTGKQLGLF